MILILLLLFCSFHFLFLSICYLITGCLYTVFIIVTLSKITLLNVDDRVISTLDSLS